MRNPYLLLGIENRGQSLEEIDAAFDAKPSRRA